MGNEVGVPLLETAPRPVRYGADTIAVDVVATEARRRRQAPSGRSVGKLCGADSATAKLAAVLQYLQTIGGSRGHSCFECARQPRVTIRSYLQHLEKYGGVAQDCLSAAVVYIARYAHATGAAVDSRNVHRLMITAFVLAAKTRDDFFYTNGYYAEVGGVTLAELNRMEAAFLCALDWDLHLEQEDVDAVIALADEPLARRTQPSRRA
eukprot:TRINITY_DN5316_c0_g1_i1.p1 TRINITY_DN5316_c0_g1~~TRINITY_DN5316_c0_g1_i1.p1  ORF type:complete len:208 (+),score=64.94 TRINITY_DN5316_c0_g1_i1:309-932(+)